MWPSEVKGQSSRDRRASDVLLPALALGIDFVLGGGASHDGLHWLVDMAAWEKQMWAGLRVKLMSVWGWSLRGWDHGETMNENQTNNEWWARWTLNMILVVPVGGAVELGMNLLLHQAPGTRWDEELFIHTVPQTVRDPAWDTHRLFQSLRSAG